MAKVPSASVVTLLIVSCLCPAQTPVGWRGDGSGRYSQADPPTQWSAEGNVVWKCPLPKWSNATPVVTSDRVFVCSEPTDLICVSKADGKILWSRSNNYDLVMTDADKAQAEKDQAEAQRIRKEELGPLEKERREVDLKVQSLQPPRPAASSGPATAPALTEEQRAELATLRSRSREIRQKIEEVGTRLEAHSKWQVPGTEGSNGHSSATAVSDGKVVAAVFNNGMAVCYDLEGNFKWARFIDRPPHKTWGSSASPLIHQDRLLVHFVNMVGLDLATGKEVWKAADTEWRWGTPVLSRIGQTDVAVTAAGDVIRLSDGKLMVRRLMQLTYNSPIVHEGVAYFIQNKGKAARLAPKGEDGMEAQVLWTTMPQDDRYYASPLLHDGLVYAVHQKNLLSVIDAATGQVVAEKDLQIGKQTVYPSICLAGNYLYVSNEDGRTVVLEPGKEMKEVARNDLGDRFRSTPVFEGSRMYIRGYKALHCIGK